MLKKLASTAIALALVACAQFAPQAASPTSQGSALPSASRTGFRIAIKIPRKRAKRSRYISPDTKSIAIVITPVTGNSIASNRNLTPSDPACKGNPLVCTFSFQLAPGNYTASFTTYSGALSAGQPTGNVLSANQSANLTIVKGRNSILNVTLGGVASSFLITPSNAVAMSADAGGFDIFGNAPQTFSIQLQDASGDTIVGPGAPTAVISSTPTGTAIATPAPDHPDVWTLTSTYDSTNPLTPMSSTMSISATPVPGSGGTTVQQSVPLQLYQPWIYVAKSTGITAYDERGNAKTFTANQPFLMVSSPGSVVYDPHNQLLYVANESGGSNVTAYDVEGNQQVLYGAPPFGGLNLPANIAFDPANNFLYVTSVTGNQVKVYDEEGNDQSAYDSSFNVTTPVGIAYYPTNGNIYVTGRGDNNVAVFTGAGSQVTTFGSLNTPTGIAYDSNNGLFYVANTGSARISVFDPSGNAVSVGSCLRSAPSNPQGVMFDPYQNLIYVADSGVGVFTCDEAGTTITPLSGFASGPLYLSIVP